MWVSSMIRVRGVTKRRAALSDEAARLSGVSRPSGVEAQGQPQNEGAVLRSVAARSTRTLSAYYVRAVAFPLPLSVSLHCFRRSDPIRNMVMAMAGLQRRRRWRQLRSGSMASPVEVLCKLGQLVHQQQDKEHHEVWNPITGSYEPMASLDHRPASKQNSTRSGCGLADVGAAVLAPACCGVHVV